MGTRLKPEEIAYRLKTAVGNPAVAADNQLVAPPGVGFKIVVYGYQLWAAADTAQTAIFRSAANPIYPAMVLGATAGAKSVYDCTPGLVPLFECNPNEALNLNLAAATAVGVAVQYVIERV